MSRAERLANVLEGSWRSSEAGMTVHLARITEESDRVRLYEEVAPETDLATPLEQRIIELFEFEGELRLRALEFRRPGGAMPTLVGLWTVPDRIPAFDDEMLFPSFDMIVTAEEDGWHAGTPHPYPIMGEGVERTVEVSISQQSIQTTAHVGGAEPVTLAWERYDPSVSGQVLEGGVVAIDYAPPQGEPAAGTGDTVTVLYTGYNERGQVFDSNRREDREPFEVKLPGRVIRGWQVGLQGVSAGTVRRLVIPPEMGYGARSPHPLIPANETLCFDIEVLSVTPGG